MRSADLHVGYMRFGGWWMVMVLMEGARQKLWGLGLEELPIEETEVAELVFVNMGYTTEYSTTIGAKNR